MRPAGEGFGRCERSTLLREKGPLGSPRNILFALLLVASVIVFWTALRDLASLAWRADEYTHTALIPLVSLILLYLRRREVFAHPRYSWGAGGLLLLAGIIGDQLSLRYSAPLGRENELLVRILAVVIVWMGALVLCFGIQVFRAGAFPLLFTLLMVPIPGPLMEKPLVLIQHGSAEVTSLLFAASQVPVFRDGMRFSLPGVDMEIAAECSGIHSTIALLITSFLVCYFWIRPGWKRVTLILSVFPIVCLTNGLRIFTIAVLAAYVNPIVFRGNLHRRGGVFFFLLALLLLAGVVKLLSKAGNGRLAIQARKAALGDD